jgi:hypothetical protein
MSDALFLIGLVFGLGILYVLVPVVLDVYRQYRRSRTVLCPEEGREARIEFDARRAAISAAYGAPKLEIVGCSFWPERGGCAQSCIKH